LQADSRSGIDIAGANPINGMDVEDVGKQVGDGIATQIFVRIKFIKRDTAVAKSVGKGDLFRLIDEEDPKVVPHPSSSN
jgi:hypothetical protein